MTLADAVPGLTDYDVRGTVEPLASQLRAGAALGATDLRWNEFGTPASILPADGVLASGYSKDPAKAPDAARDWLSENVALLRLTKAQVSGLELVNNAALADSGARAVLFRQRFGSLTPAIGSMVTVGVADGKIAYVSSSLTRTTGSPAAARLTPLQGWLARRQERRREAHARRGRRHHVPRLRRRVRGVDPAERARHRPGAAGSHPGASRSPTAASGRSSRPTWSTSPAAPRRRTPSWSTP